MNDARDHSLRERFHKFFRQSPVLGRLACAVLLVYLWAITPAQLVFYLLRAAWEGVQDEWLDEVWPELRSRLELTPGGLRFILTGKRIEDPLSKRPRTVEIRGRPRPF